MRQSVPTLALALAGTALAVPAKEDGDHLYSSRLAKRGIDAAGHFNISFFHVNDVHAHLDEYSSSGTDCTRPERGCYGGYARIKHTVDELRPQYNDSLWLNAGDEFQGTLFYSFYKGEKIAETINQLGFDAMTLGNHEFDGGDDQLGDFLLNLTFPIVAANIESDNEKLNKTIKPYHIFDKQQLAVIGVTTPTTPGISSPGKGTKFHDVVTTVQSTIDHIKSTTNITRIAALTHIGYEEDQKLAEETSGLYLIMGGHSHTLLGDMEDAEGPYPTITKNKDGDDVFIVTAYRWGEYVGYIDVTYDTEGKVLAYHGGPIHLTNTTEQDPDLQAQIEAWRGPFEAFAAEVVGVSNVELDQTLCQRQECLLGNVMTDAMYEYRLNNSDSTPPDFALINAGGIRATIDKGDITRGEVLTSFPFGNSIVEITYKGADIRKVLEGAVSRVNQFNNLPITSGFQVSRNIVVEYNPAGNNGSRLVSVTIAGEALDDEKDYRVVTLDFLAGGGDNIFVATTDFVSLDTQDEVLVQYVQAKSPIDAEIEGRIVQSNGTTSSPSGTATGSAAVPSSTSGESGASMVSVSLGAIALSLFAILAI
ncbi:5'-nucleotidase domain-containing protein [Colletotrichum graminicola]|uniref:5'-nucleotidase domain-containing protein n=1 Tax=Colletotrichum graminicola (strain M1.001 / M2 / FGSC 10212) TaxID=645133 RepID=E3Q5G4_COLGM|nr:5'-nucleotidase domain-containing protein [Colletotrichum graminicola M1.001]EFQ25931.1 5'-nucleotidase domain-containing protein [Colletotrichum graminicola M1.001]WDK23051.1 5'-nucleotidase domain-containing protein [Colletotrichum graminicola]